MPVTYTRKPASVKSVTPARAPTWEVGTRVTHERYGLGRVIKIVDDQVLVDFGEGHGQPRRIPSHDRRMIEL
jgi:hypothetical protein